MHIFISHNKKQKSRARLLAMALVEHGESVWFDEWNICPGESLTGGIEKGLEAADVFVLIWSKQAADSKWVGTELRAYLRRRVDDDSLRIIPVMVDDTPLPTLVADYRGFSAKSARSITTIARQICGMPSDAEIVRRLRKRLEDLTVDSEAGREGDPLPFKRCPECGEDNLRRHTATDDKRDDVYYVIRCASCEWTEWTE